MILTKEVGGINPSGGITMIERGLNRTNKLEHTLTKSDYLNRVKRESRFTPALPYIAINSSLILAGDSNQQYTRNQVNNISANNTNSDALGLLTLMSREQE